MVFSDSWSGLEGQGGFHLLKQYFIQMAGRIGSANPFFISMSLQGLSCILSRSLAATQASVQGGRKWKLLVSSGLISAFWIIFSSNNPQKTLRFKDRGIHSNSSWRGIKKYIALFNPAYFPMGVLPWEIGFPTLIDSKLMRQTSWTLPEIGQGQVNPLCMGLVNGTY